MLFYSTSYLLFFLPLSLLFFFYGNKFKIDRKIILIFLSIFFYSWWNIYYLPVILFSILINYYFYTKLKFNNANKKIILWVGISLNILLLIVFKYTDFIIQNLNLVFSTNIQYLNLPFPLAISFLLFRALFF